MDLTKAQLLWSGNQKTTHTKPQLGFHRDQQLKNGWKQSNLNRENVRRLSVCLSVCPSVRMSNQVVQVYPSTWEKNLPLWLAKNKNFYLNKTI
jgi:hypothetical protein